MNNSGWPKGNDQCGDPYPKQVSEIQCPTCQKPLTLEPRGLSSFPGCTDYLCLTDSCGMHGLPRLYLRLVAGKPPIPTELLEKLVQIANQSHRLITLS